MTPVERFVIPGEQTARMSASRRDHTGGFLEYTDIDANQVPDEVNITPKFRSQEEPSVEEAREMVAQFQRVHGEKWAQVLTLAAATQDSLKNFKPLGWAGFGRTVWYDEPIYNALVKEFGFDPLAVRT